VADSVRREAHNVTLSYCEDRLLRIELNAKLISAICLVQQGNYRERIAAMRAAGINERAISNAIELHRSQRRELAIRLCSESLGMMKSVVENLKPTFENAGSEVVMQVYSGVSRAIDSASTALRNQDAVSEFNEILEILTAVNHELGSRTRIIRANPRRALTRVFGRKPRAAPLTQEVIAAVTLSDDLSFLNKSSWSKRVEALRQQEHARYLALGRAGQASDPNRGRIRAGDRHVINILKTIPRVRRYLHRMAE